MPLPEAAILTYERTKAENFQNTLDPNFDLYVKGFICTNFKAFTTFGAIFIFIHCTIFLSISFSHISGRTKPNVPDCYYAYPTSSAGTKYLKYFLVQQLQQNQTIKNTSSASLLPDLCQKSAYIIRKLHIQEYPCHSVLECH